MSQFPTLKEKINEIIAKLEERQERLVPGQSGYKLCGDMLSMLKHAIIEKKKEISIIGMKPRGRPKGGHNRSNLVFLDNE